MEAKKIYKKIEKWVPDVLKKETETYFILCDYEGEDIQYETNNDIEIDIIFKYNNKDTKDLEEVTIFFPADISNYLTVTKDSPTPEVEKVSGYFMLNDIRKSLFNAKLCGNICTELSFKDLILSDNEKRKMLAKENKPEKYRLKKHFTLKADIILLHKLEEDRYRNNIDTPVFSSNLIAFLINLKEESPVPSKQLFFILLHESIDSDFSSYTTATESLFGPVETVQYNIDKKRVARFGKIIEKFDNKLRTRYSKTYFLDYFLNKNKEIKKYYNNNMFLKQIPVEYYIVMETAHTIYITCLLNLVNDSALRLLIDNFEFSTQEAKNFNVYNILINDVIRNIEKVLEKNWAWLNKSNDSYLQKTMTEPPYYNKLTKEQYQKTIELLNNSFTDAVLDKYKEGIVKVIIPQAFVYLKMIEEMIPSNITDKQRKQMEMDIKKTKSDLVAFLKTLKK